MGCGGLQDVGYTEEWEVVRMPGPVVSFVHAIESFTERLGKVFVWLVIVLIAILLIEAGMRYFAHVPTVWSLELSEFVFGTYFFVAGGYTLLHNRHIRMDAFYSRWSRKRRALVDAITFSIIAVYLIFFFVGGIGNSMFSLKFNMVSQSAWGPPMSPIRIIITVGVFLMFLMALVQFIRDIAVVRGKEIA